MDIRHLFSVLLFLIGLVIYFSLKYYYKKKGDLSISRYNESILIRNKEGLINNILIALKKSNFERISFDQKQHKFFAITRKTMSSPGEFLIIEMINLDQSKVKLKFLSQCMSPFQVYAWGKNKKNYNRFQTELLKFTA